MSQSDESLSQSGESIEVEQHAAPVVDLEATAQADELLWNDEHSSDDEAFDPENPTDLLTENAKEAARFDDASQSGEGADASDEDEPDDSIVCSDDEVELECEDHDICVSRSQDVFALLVQSMSCKTSKRQAKAALTEAICDHFKSL